MTTNTASPTEITADDVTVGGAGAGKSYANPNQPAEDPKAKSPSKLLDRNSYGVSAEVRAAIVDKVRETTDAETGVSTISNGDLLVAADIKPRTLQYALRYLEHNGELELTYARNRRSLRLLAQ